METKLKSVTELKNASLSAYVGVICKLMQSVSYTPSIPNVKSMLESLGYGCLTTLKDPEDVQRYQIVADLIASL
jgi:hypothetical protein